MTNDSPPFRAETDARRWLPPSRPEVSSRRGQGRALTIVLFLAWIGIGIAIVFMLDRQPQGLRIVPFGLAVAGFLIGLWIHVALHEVGHALAGILAGQRVFGAGLGRWRLERGQHRWRLRRSATRSGLGGFVALAPVDPSADSRWRQCVYLSGGVLMNLGVAAAGFACLRLTTPGAGWVALLTGFSLAALMLGVVNLLPFRSHGWHTDGLAMWLLLRGGREGGLRMAIVRLVGLGLAGVRPRQWKTAWLPDSGIETDDPMLAAGSETLRWVHAVDRRDAAQADIAALQLLQRFHRVPEAMQAALAVNLATHVARFHPDAEVLAEWLPLCRDGLLDYSAQRAVLRAELAILRQEWSLARDALTDAERCKDRIHDAASAHMLVERMEALSSQLAAQTLRASDQA